MTKKLTIIFGLTMLLLLGIVGIKFTPLEPIIRELYSLTGFSDIGQREDGILGTAEAAEETNITYRNIIEDFEEDPVYLDQPGSDGWYFKKATHYPFGDFAWEIDPTQGANGTNRSLKLTALEYTFYIWYMNQDENVYINRNAEFPVNRMRFYIKFPQGWQPYPLPTDYNVHIGTYHRDPKILGSHETDNWHFYQWIVADTYDNGWIKVDLNQWAQHQRDYDLHPVGINPTKPKANFNEHWSRWYITTKLYKPPIGVTPPYNVWFDEFEFYYQNEYVATQPEYYEKPILPESAIYYPITITNTHSTENRRFGLAQSTNQFSGGNYWNYDIKIIRDDNGDGIHQDTENTVVNETTLLNPNEKFKIFIRVATPGQGKYTPGTSYWWTAFVAYQKEPVWPGDPHLVNTAYWYGVSPGTPAAGVKIITRAVSSLPPADTIPPAPIQDLIIQQVYDHSVKLAWSAPGDDGITGTAYAYDVRYSTSPITEENFEDALPFTDELAPKNSGAQEVYVVPPLLEPETLYYFALKAYDEIYQATIISNVANAITLKAEEKKDIKVYAGSGQTITMPAIANLNGNVKRDGFSDPSIPTTWSKMSGPGTVTFGDISSWATTATFSEAGQYVLQLTADDQGYIVSGSVPIVVRPLGDASAILLVDFGKNAQDNKFGLQGWSTVAIDIYDSYTMVGPAGVVGNTNTDYSHHVVSGTPYTFAIGDKIIVTWYNNSDNPITITPRISFDDPDRIGMGEPGAWHSMSKVTIASYGIATSEFIFDGTTAGAYALVNVNNNFSDDRQALVCDKTELVKYAPPTPKLTLTKSADKTQAAPGDIITYTIAYQNIGTGEATNVVITDPIPAGTIYETDSARFASGSGIINDKGPIISWTIVALPAGQTGEAEFRVIVAE